ncbi:MAG: TIGR00730 family Rossman fold protein [Betaproteobacteria bacterium]
MTLSSVCVFCGSRPGNDPAFAAAARTLGEALAASGRRLVYGGGHVGIMGILADAALGAGGEVVGVIPRALQERELAQRNLTRLHVVGSMHERKALMADLAEGFIALPGGLGTLEEFFEIWTWVQLGLMAKPLGLLNVGRFFDPLLAFLDQVQAKGFIPREHLGMVSVAAQPAELLELLERKR